MEQRGELFDYILLETTGLADPGNIAPMFWLDDGLGSTIFLDGIVTLVDAKNVLKSLDEGYGDENKKDEGHDEHGSLLTTAHLQISHADVIIVNKTDLVSEAELQNVVDRIRSINGLARIETTTKSQVPQLEGMILDLHAYDEVSDADLKFASKGHSHLDPVSPIYISQSLHSTYSLQTITTTTISFPALKPFQVDKFDLFLRTILWEETLPHITPDRPFEIHRLKARIPVTDGRMLLIQGVRNIYDTNEIKAPKPSGDEQAKLVLIGKAVEQSALRESLMKTLDS
jgi:G3E family GTPase